MINLSLSTVNVNAYLYDYGTTVAPGTATHSLTLYRAESGALVFGAGTVYWSLGPRLPPHAVRRRARGSERPAGDGQHVRRHGHAAADAPGEPRPGDPEHGFHRAYGGDHGDRHRLADFLEGQVATITGTAADVGGIVAGVEVSTDSGQTWHKASGRETWSYSWFVQAAGTYQIKARAVDDSVNIGAATAATAAAVVTGGRKSLFTFDEKPATEFVLDNRGGRARGQVLEFRRTAASRASASGSRRRSRASDVAHLWTESGALLGTATFTVQSYSGWQTVFFDTPIAITPGQTYIASFHTRVYSATDNYFTTAHTSGPLTTPANAAVFAYGDNGTFPSQSGGSTNYYVDVVFQPVAQAAPVAVADSVGPAQMGTAFVISAATLLGNDTDANGDTLTISSVGGASHGTVSLNAQGTEVTFTPDAGYSGGAGFTYSISDGQGGSASAGVSLSVVPGSALPVSFFAPDATPAVPSENDSSAVELGMQFQVSVAGTVTGIRFYKGAGNTGTHTGTLWSSDGQALATVTFVAESASGWQTAMFSNPVAVTPGQTYTASYHTGTGHYSDTADYFTAPKTSGPLTTPVNAGVYAYGSTSQRPTNSFNAANYFVDVVFQPAGQAPPVATTIWGRR